MKDFYSGDRVTWFATGLGLWNGYSAGVVISGTPNPEKCIVKRDADGCLYHVPIHYLSKEKPC